MSKEVKIIIAIAVVVIGGGIWLFTRQPQTAAPGQAVDAKSLLRDTSHMTGSKDAKVIVVEFGDYECPGCAAAEPNVERLRQEYKDNANVNFAFRNFPLPQHRYALITAEAAEAAGAQGKFWEMHDKLYQAQGEWSASQSPLDLLANYAQQLGLDVNKLKQEVQNNTYADVIKADQSDATSLSVNSTPTFFINGEKTSGYQYDELKSKIEEKLK